MSTETTSDTTTGHAPAEGANPAVDHPRHYNLHPAGIECVDVIEHMTLNVGTAVKYCWRSGLKDPTVQDLEKAIWYLRREVERVKAFGLDKSAMLSEISDAELRVQLSESLKGLVPPPRTHPSSTCTHGVTFNESAYDAAKDAGAYTEGLVAWVRKYHPRLNGKCTTCGFEGVAYASEFHKIAGDW